MNMYSDTSTRLWKQALDTGDFVAALLLAYESGRMDMCADWIRDEELNIEPSMTRLSALNQAQQFDHEDQEVSA